MCEEIIKETKMDDAQVRNVLRLGIVAPGRRPSTCDP